MPVEDSDIARTWGRIEAWARNHMPGLTAQLGAPASRASIAHLERFLGFPLPLDFVASLMVHDGEDDDGALLDSREGLLPVVYIEEVTARDRRSIAKNSSLLADTVSGPANAKLYHLRRVVVAHCNYDVMLLLDFAPAEGGVAGQVLRRDVEGGSLQVVAPSWAAFLADYADRLEAGRVRFDPEIEARLRRPVIKSVSEKDRLSRFAAAIRLQAKAVDLATLADGAEVELVGSLGLPANSMGPDEYPFGLFSGTLTLKGALGITRQEIMNTNLVGGQILLKVRGTLHRTSSGGRHRSTLVVTAFEPYK